MFFVLFGFLNRSDRKSQSKFLNVYFLSVFVVVVSLVLRTFSMLRLLFWFLFVFVFRLLEIR